jgi:16S rRNA (cytosine967-C5)-methyltransferase
MNTRLIATQILKGVLRDKRSLNEVLAEGKSKCKTTQDQALVQALCFGVLRWYPKLYFISTQLLQKPLKPKDQDLLYLICVGLYQLIEMRIPDHAAISETVEATRLLNKPWAAGLMNALLRNYLRQKEKINLALKNTQDPLYLEATYAHPLWLIKALQKAWPADWEALLNENNLHPPFSIRVNTQQISRDAYQHLLLENAIQSTPIAHTLSGLILENTKEITALPGFEAGYFSVQDGASQLVGPLLQLAPGLRVLDACSAPGGKTTHLLELEPHLAELIAVDIAPERTQRIQENLNRLKLKATVITADATQPDTWWDGKLFDRILIDAPCSATGIIRRHPDIKYLRQPTDIQTLNQQQAKLLNVLWTLLKPDGLLVYTTCSIMPAENTDIMEAFLNTHPSAKPQALDLPIGLSQPVGHQLLAGQNGCDGFYYALIQNGAKK